MTNIRSLLEENGFTVKKYADYWNVQQYTPAGEDWNLDFNKLADIKSYAENFDPEEEFTMWIEAKNNGFAGVPNYSELWQDQLWKQEILTNIARSI